MSASVLDLLDPHPGPWTEEEFLDRIASGIVWLPGPFPVESDLAHLLGES